MRVGRPLKKFICEYCGKEVSCKWWDKRKFCSMSCSVAHKNKNRVWADSSRKKISDKNKGRLAGDNNPNWQGGGIDLVCNQCGEIFHLAAHRLQRQKGYFCSRECFDQFLDERKMSEPQKTIHDRIRRSVASMLIRGRGYQKWNKIIPYTADELRAHLESKFTDGMTWDNHGLMGWHIDHIIPVGMWDNSIAELRACWAISNLQPLWRDDNVAKGGVKHFSKVEIKVL